MVRILTVIFFFASRIAVASDQINLSPGHQRVISNVEVVRAAIGNPSVANIKVLTGNKQVIVTGIAAGSTDLILWQKDGLKVTYSIHVRTGTRNFADEPRKLLEGIEGIELKQVGSKWILDGQLYRGSDVARVNKVLRLYPTIVNFTRVNRDALSYIAKELERSLLKSGFSGVTVQIVGDALFLEGTVHGKNEIDRVRELASSMYSNVTNHVTTGFNLERLVLVDVKLMEVKTNALGQVGMKWPNSIDATANTSDGLTITQSSPLSLRALIEKGAARILSNPKLLCRNGTPASFLAGGEVPIRLVSEHSASVTFKEYGVTLLVTAHVDRGQQVFLEIETRISDLDNATAVDGIPGILEHRVKTAANLRMGDTVVLGGILDNRSRKNIQKVPFLGHIPILGELFKSRDFQQNQSEFLAFLTPIPADSTNPMAGQEIGKIHQSDEKTQKEIEISILD